MKHRIFIAIDLPEDIKQELIAYQANWPELPVRWTKIENLHITLSFLGYLSDEEIAAVCEATKGVTQENKSFRLRLNRLLYGPEKKLPPRMIWVDVERSDVLAQLKDEVEKGLMEKIGFFPEKRYFSSHITLGRIRGWEWRRIEPENRPNVEQEISLEFQVDSIDVMESKLKRTGAEYIIIEKCPLQL